jgi:hypothetical protein
MFLASYIFILAANLITFSLGSFPCLKVMSHSEVFREEDGGGGVYYDRTLMSSTESMRKP